MRRFVLFVLSCTLMLTLIPLAAQDEPLVNSSIVGFPLPELVPITVENADKVVELARIGSGTIAETAWSPDGTLLLFASSLGVWVYDTRTPDAHAVLIPCEVTVTSVASSDKLIAGGDEAGNIHLWDRQTFAPVATLINHLYAVRGVAFNADGSLLASADQSGVARLWDIARQSEVSTAYLSGAFFDGITFDNDRVYLRDALSPSLAPDSPSYLYDVLWQSGTDTPERLVNPYLQLPPLFERVNWGESSVESAGGDTILDVAFSRAPELAVMVWAGPLVVWSDADAASGDRLVDNFSLVDGTSLDHFTASGLEDVVEVQVSNGILVAEGGDSTRIAISSATIPGATLPALFGHTRGVPTLAFSPTAPDLLVSGSLDTTLRLWDVTAPPDTPSLVVLEGHHAGVRSVSINPSGDLIASTSYDGTIRLWGVVK